MLRNTGRTGRRWLLALLIAAGLLMLPQGKAFAEGKIAISISSDHILTWTDYPGVGSYWLEIDGGSWNIKDLPKTGTNKIDLKAIIDEKMALDLLKNNGRHSVNVQGYDAAMETRLAISDSKIVKYISSVLPYTPDAVNLTAELSASGILSWKALANADLYRIWINGEYSSPVTAGTITEFKIDLKERINELHLITESFDSKGPYKIKLVAYENETELDLFDCGSFDYDAKLPFSDAYVTVSGIKNMTYTGSEVKLSLTVKYGSKTLEEGKDYTVSYKNNIKVGDAAVVLKGIGAYEGSFEKIFSILSASENSGDNTAVNQNDNKDSTGQDATAEDDTTNTGSDQDEKAAVLKKGVTVESAENLLASYKAESDPAGTGFRNLQLYASGTEKTKITLKWKKVKNVSKYVLYGNLCGTKNAYQKIAQIRSSKKACVVKKAGGKALRPGKYYKFLLVAYDRNDKVLTASKIVHAATAGGKAANPVKLTTAAKKNRVTLKRGKTFKLKAVTAAASGKQKIRIHRKLCFESSNTKIATVTARGVIKGRKKGACYVYAYAQNGLFKKIRVTVTQ